MDFTAGVYYFWQEADDIQRTAYGRDASLWLTTPNTPTAAVSTLPGAALDGLEAIARVIPATKSYAAFGQATWNLSPALRLTGGLRYTYEHKTGLYDAGPGGTPAALDTFPLAQQAAVAARRRALVPVGRYDVSNDTDNLSGTIIAAYDLSADVHGYASYSRGFKSPGINLVAPANGVDIFVRPEQVDAYELGLKSRLFGGRAEVNLALFWSDVDDYQANFLNRDVVPIVSYISNVGKLRSRGVELDARATPLDGVTLTLAGTYNDAKYRRYENGPTAYLNSYLGSVDLSGRRASGAPKWSLAGTAEYVHRTGARDFYVGGDATYRSAFYATVNLDPFARVAGYTLAGLHAGVRERDGRWDVSLWVRNLFDKDFYNTKSVSPQFGVIYGALGEPRLYGLTVRTRFGG